MNAFVHGHWSSWNFLTECSETFGNGVRFAERNCSNPAPRYNGSACIGQKSVYLPCTITGIWNDWTSDPCNATCGKGMQKRWRECPDGDACIGKNQTVNECEIKDCNAAYETDESTDGESTAVILTVLLICFFTGAGLYIYRHRKRKLGRKRESQITEMMLKNMVENFEHNTRIETDKHTLDSHSKTVVFKESSSQQVLLTTPLTKQSSKEPINSTGLRTGLVKRNSDLSPRNSSSSYGEDNASSKISLSSGATDFESSGFDMDTSDNGDVSSDSERMIDVANTQTTRNMPNSAITLQGKPNFETRYTPSLTRSNESTQLKTKDSVDDKTRNSIVSPPVVPIFSYLNNINGQLPSSPKHSIIDNRTTKNVQSTIPLRSLSQQGYQASSSAGSSGSSSQILHSLNSILKKPGREKP